jgi:hypothetical protein
VHFNVKLPFIFSAVEGTDDDKFWSDCEEEEEESVRSEWEEDEVTDCEVGDSNTA